MTDIAFASGFASLRRFNDAFSTRYKMPPTRLRRKATEGGQAAVGFARDRLGLSRLVAFALPENGASIAVMRRLGFRHDGEQSIFGLNAVRYVLVLARET